MEALLDCLAVGAGGALGAVSRHLLGLIPVKNAGGFPLVTFGINLAGAFLIGILASLAGRQQGMDQRLMLFLKVGLCGGFTTFSTFSLESAGLLQGGKPAVAALYAALSVVCCILAVFGAQALVK